MTSTTTRTTPAGDGAEAGTAGALRVQLVNSYVGAAADVLAQETGDVVRRGAMTVETASRASDDVTALIGVRGSLGGSFWLSLSESTAMRLVGGMLGTPCEVFDELAQSGIAELANVIAGSAAVRLAELGHAVDITPPMLILGSGACISSVAIPRLCIQLASTHGALLLCIALRETDPGRR
jgi:chemotaxis protein CheX